MHAEESTAETVIDGPLLQTIARECLGIRLTETEAAALVGPYLSLRAVIRTLDSVPLEFSREPFMSPGNGDDWLKRWPDK